MDVDDAGGGRTATWATERGGFVRGLEACTTAIDKLACEVKDLSGKYTAILVEQAKIKTQLGYVLAILSALGITALSGLVALLVNVLHR